MSEGKDKTLWFHTLMPMTQTANLNRDLKQRKKPYDVWEFMPFKRPKQKRRTVSKQESEDAFFAMKEIFINGRK